MCTGPRKTGVLGGGTGRKERSKNGRLSLLKASQRMRREERTCLRQTLMTGNATETQVRVTRKYS
ncbi:hypothetical protein LEMLEM_LOCUS23390, partial [Lemmus lemmus]